MTEKLSVQGAKAAPSFAKCSYPRRLVRDILVDVTRRTPKWDLPRQDASRGNDGCFLYHDSDIPRA